MKQFRILLFILSLSTLGFTAKAQVLASDSLALVALYNSTNGPGWTLKINWLTGPVSSWFGITVIGNRVSNISLNSNQLNGFLPMELGNLSGLNGLSMINNQIGGSLPSQLSNLTNLTFLQMFGNQLSGNLPSGLGTLSQLTHLSLADNNFTGNIPKNLGNLINLNFLGLRGNQFTGAIPSELGNLTNLTTAIVLNNNNLSGLIPSELGNLVNIQRIELQNNQLTGNIPSEIGNLNSLQQFIINDNQLTGIIPLEITNLTSLIKFEFFNTNLCESQNAIFQTWKTNVGSYLGTSLKCVGTYNIKEGELLKGNGDNVVFSTTIIGNEQLKQLEITNTGNTQLVITDIQVTGDFSLQSAIPPPIDPGNNTLLSLRFAPTDLGARLGILTILSNGDVPVFTINLTGEGEIEPIFYNVVTTNKNGKHDFLNIANITYFPENKVIIYDRWGNKVFERNGYDNAQNVFAGTSDDNIELPDGTYYYVIDKNNGDKPLHGFIYLRR